MAPLEASSGSAPVSRQRPPSTLLRDGVGRGRLRYRPLLWRLQWGAGARGADSGDGWLGPSWGAAAPLGRSSGATAGRRLVALVDFCASPFWPGAVGLLLRRVESIVVPVDIGRFWPGAEGVLLPASRADFGKVAEPRSTHTSRGRRCAGSSPFETRPSALYSR